MVGVVFAVFLSLRLLWVVRRAGLLAFVLRILWGVDGCACVPGLGRVNHGMCSYCSSIEGAARAVCSVNVMPLVGTLGVR